MAGALLVPADNGVPIVPQQPPPDMAVADNYEVFDGLTPLEHPAADENGRLSMIPVGGPRPGQSDSQRTKDVYTPGPLSGVRGVVGGMPLPVEYPLVGRPPGSYTPSKALTIQWRLGVGQKGPSALGVEQTLQLSQVTDNPPQAGSLDAIVAGWG